MHDFLSRLLAAALFGSMTLSAVPAVAADSFPDVPASSPFYEAITTLRSEGVIEGNPDGSYKPSATINRAEFLKIILEARGDTPSGGGNCFPDVRSEWFASYVCAAKEEGIIQGYPDGMFKPEQAVNFVEAGKILSLAYDQPLDQYSPDWYEPYARALESGNAIPGSIAKLDAPLTRGEMAEMMWRLSHAITTKESKAYLNVKYPEVGVNLATTEPVRATSCADLRAFSQEAARGNSSNAFRGFGDDVLVVPANALGAERAQEESTSDGDFSKTNVQVDGVDEGDIVKSDGSYLYTINDGIVRIVRVSDMTVLSTLNLQKENFNPSDLYIDGNRLVVLGSTWGDVHIMNEVSEARMMIWPGPWYNQESQVRIYSTTNKSSPALERTVSFDGSLASTRRIDDKLYVVLNQPVQPWGPVPLLREASAEDVLPTFRDSARGNEDVAVAPCSSVTILPRIPSPQYITVATVPLQGNGDVQRSVVLGSAENVYASLDNLYTASTEYQYYWNEKSNQGPTQRTHIYRFAFTGDGMEMRAKGLVEGRLLNQFSMDEDGDTFRIATTEDGNWDGTSRSSNNLFVLNLNLEEVGKIEDIAPGEQIYSVRFMGNRAYMVTFRTIDPLFVIDVSNPRSPAILGQLKIPGYSDYLHPYDENHIIGFGKEAVESKDGTFAWQQGVKVALFDVSDVQNPKQKHNIVIGDRGTDSVLLHNHKALLFDKSRNLLAFPISVAEVQEDQRPQGEEPDSAWGQQVFQGAHVYDLTLAGGFKLRGTITHYTQNDLLKAGGYLYGKDVERVVRIDDALYTISADGVKKHDEQTVKEEGGVSFRAPIDPTACAVKENATYQSKDPDVCATLRFFCPDNQEAFHNACGCGCM